jgi:hypothetical protein
MLTFLVFCKSCLIVSCSFSEVLSEYKSSWPYTDWCPPQKYECPPLWNGSSYGIKNYGVEVTFNEMNFIKTYQLIQKLMEEREHTGIGIFMKRGHNTDTFRTS